MSIGEVSPKRLLPRMLAPKLARDLQEFPAVVLQGARAIGKTTLARSLAAAEINLSDSAQRSFFTADPAAALREAAKPVLLDEWQVMPDCLWAVKSLIDDEEANGFIVAGSASPPPDDRRLGQFPLTGRAVVRDLRAMCKAERSGAEAVPVADLLLSEQPDWPVPERLSQRDYVAIAAESGYPACVGMDPSEEDRYMQGVVGTALQHDIAAAGRQRGGERFRQAMLGFLRSFALHSGRITSLRAIADHARISDRAAAGYQAVFSAYHLIEDVEVWRPSADSSPAKHPKRMVCDPGMMAVMAGLERQRLLAEPVLLDGLMETFVAAQIRAQQSAASTNHSLLAYNHHPRSKQDFRYPEGEIDFLLESSDGSAVAAVEVKTGNRADPRHARRMAALRDAMDDKARQHPPTSPVPPMRFTCGVVLVCGEAPIRSIGDRLWIAPMSLLWASPPA